MKIIQAFRKLSGRAPLALLISGFLEWEGAQIPIGAARRRENWSFSRDPQGRLVFSQSFRTAGVFWVIPVRRGAEVRCVLPGSGG